MSVAGTTFEWPVPDRTVTVGGRAMSLEIAVAGGLYGLAAVWLLWSIRDVVGVLPDLLSGLFGSEFEFAFSWLILMVLAFLAYVIGLLTRGRRSRSCAPTRSAAACPRSSRSPSSCCCSATPAPAAWS